MGGELKVAYLVGELFSLRVEIHRNPADMVLGGVGVGHLLSQGHLEREKLASFNLVGTLYYGNMFLRFPVCGLKKLSKLLHCLLLSL